LNNGTLAGFGTLISNDFSVENGVISQHLAGAGTLSVNNGSVTLSNSNFYTGGTHLTSGTLNIDSVANLGDGTVIFRGGFLRTNASMTLPMILESDTNGGGIDCQFATTITGAASFNPTSTFTKSGPGTLILPSGNPNFGSLTISAGEVWFNGSVTPTI